jgi:hypothetical protein
MIIATIFIRILIIELSLKFFSAVTEGVVVYVEKPGSLAFIPSGHLVSLSNVKFL